jgi:hypothetical protein
MCRDLQRATSIVIFQKTPIAFPAVIRQVRVCGDHNGHTTVVVAAETTLTLPVVAERIHIRVLGDTDRNATLSLLMVAICATVFGIEVTRISRHL